MSMLLLTGKVLNVLQTPTGTTRDGVSYGGYHQVQILGDQVLQNGEKRSSLVTLSCDDPDSYRKLIGRDIAVPVGCWARGGTLSFSIEKGASPTVLNSGS